MKKLSLLLLFFTLLIPSVVANMVGPVRNSLWADISLIAICYVINLVLLLIFSKAWLHIDLKNLTAGLTIIFLPILLVHYLIFRFLGLPSSTLSFIVTYLFILLFIFLNFFLVSKHLWKNSYGQALVIGIVFGIINNLMTYILLFELLD